MGKGGVEITPQPNPTHVVLAVDVCACLHQRLGDLEVPILSCPVEGRLAILQQPRTQEEEGGGRER